MLYPFRGKSRAFTGAAAPARTLLLLSAVALLTLIGAACGSSSGSSSTATSSAAAAATPTTAAVTSTPAASSSASGTAESSEAGEYGSSASASPSGTPMTASPTASMAPTVVKTAQNATLGTILTDSSGRTLYVYKNDSMNVSNCTGACAQNWPPLTTTGTPSLASGVPGTLGTITRGDGSKQVTYNGMPLYTFKADSNPGDTKGQGIGNVWHVATPSAQ